MLTNPPQKNMTEEMLVDAITRKELELHHALGKALDVMDELKSLRQSPMSPEMARRGWGWGFEHEEWYSVASTMVNLVRCHGTEFGGGITDEQERILKKITRVINS